MSTLTTPAKRRGRPTAVYHPQRHGMDPVPGLMRLKDGRWRASGPEKYTFTEPNEIRAIARYLAWRSRKEDKPFTLDRTVDPSDTKAVIDAVKSLGHVHTPARPDASGFVGGTFLPPHMSELPKATGPDVLPDTAPVPVRVSIRDGKLVFSSPADRIAFWQTVADEITNNRKEVAQLTGIEQIAWLTDLKKPEPLPSFDRIEGVWKEFYTKNAEQKRKVLHAWSDFKTTTAATCLEDITPELVIAYRDNVYGRDLSGKSQQNLFTRIRRLFSFAKSRALAVEDLSKRLDYLSLLTPSESTVSLDPMPIGRKDWDKLYAAAQGDDKAMILIMLNCGMYIQEAVNLRWDDIKDDCLIAHRKKTGRCLRIAVLWKETRDALDKVNRRGEHIFIAEHGGQLGIKGAEARFRALRETAKVPHVCGSHLRDGAATAASEATEDQRIVSLLLGHRSGIRDHYAKRNPQMVAPACKAVYRVYFR